MTVEGQGKIGHNNQFSMLKIPRSFSGTFTFMSLNPVRYYYERCHYKRCLPYVEFVVGAYVHNILYIIFIINTPLQNS